MDSQQHQRNRLLKMIVTLHWWVCQTHSKQKHNKTNNEKSLKILIVWKTKQWKFITIVFLLCFIILMQCITALHSIFLFWFFDHFNLQLSELIFWSRLPQQFVSHHSTQLQHSQCFRFPNLSDLFSFLCFLTYKWAVCTVPTHCPTWSTFC